LIKEIINQEEITIVNIHTPNFSITQFHKTISTGHNAQIVP
jgi:hypothetical protein